MDLSLDNIIAGSDNKDKHNDESPKIGDFVSADGSRDSIESNDTDFSMAPEVI